MEWLLAKLVIQVREGNGTPLQYSCLEKSHGWRSLEGCSPWGHWGSDTIERLHFHFSLWCIGEGDDNPLQCSCLENPRDRGAWRAAVYGVAQSQTWLKWLSSSSNPGKNQCNAFNSKHFLNVFHHNSVKVPFGNYFYVNWMCFFSAKNDKG